MEPNAQQNPTQSQLEPENLQAPPPRTIVALPRYRSHKVVQAAKILDAQQHEGGTLLTLAMAGPNGEPGTIQQLVEDRWAGRASMEGFVGGYYVRYEDGYESWSPADAFEGGYTEEPAAGGMTAFETVRAELDAARQDAATFKREAASAQDAAAQLRAELAAATAPKPTVERHPRRLVETHRVNPANEQLVIAVLDDPAVDGANHLYDIHGFNSRSNPSDPFVARYGRPAEHSTILFQNGPIKEVGVNGVTHEALLAIVIDRLKTYQAGRYACDENRCAVAHLEQAVRFLHSRTQRRMAAGTEGTHAGS